MRLFLNGGGDGPDIAEAYRAFGSQIDKGKPLLYIPLAMESDMYPGCLGWITNELSSLHVRIQMITSGEELAGLDLKSFGGLFIGGGNTYKLLSDLKSSGAFARIQEYLESGGPIFGGSAGAILFGKDIAACQYADENEVGLKDTRGFDALNGLSLLCHYESGMEIPAIGGPVLALREEQTIYRHGDEIEIIGPRAKEGE